MISISIFADDERDEFGDLPGLPVPQHYDSCGQWCPWSGVRTTSGECPEGHTISRLVKR